MCKVETKNGAVITDGIKKEDVSKKKCLFKR